MNQKDVLIVGFGIAGSTVAHQIDQLGYSFTIVSDNAQQATRVAGGVINPIALKRYKKVWQAQLQYNIALDFYKSIQSKLGISFLFQPELYKYLKSPQDCNDFSIASEVDYLKDFLDSRLLNVNSSKIKSAYKLGLVHHIYTLNLNAYLDASIQYFESNFINSHFNYTDLIFEDSHFIYNSTQYKHVVFCEGFGVTKNPYFNDLPIYGNKGEYLVIYSPLLNSNKKLFKAKYFLIPLGQDRYKFGANYDREHLNNLPTDKTKQHLLEAFEAMFEVPYQVVDHIAGVRPTVKDRKPILGQHHSHQNMFIFNGNGSRGVLASPYLSACLVEHIFEAKELPQEVAINRYY